MREDSFTSVLDLVHDAALCPDRWDGVLRRLAALTGCVAGGLTVERFQTRRGEPLTYFGFDPGHVERSFDHYLPKNPLFQIEAQMQPGFVVTNGDVVPLKVFRQSEFYNGWARPQGLCSPVTVVLRRTAASYVPLTLVRPDGAGEVTAGGRALLSRLAPHLVHAMEVTVRLKAAQGALGGAHEGAGMMLEAMPCGALLLDRTRRIVFANAAAGRLLAESGDGPLRCVLGRLVARDPAADKRLQAAVATVLGLPERPKGSQVSLRCPAGDERLTISLAPLPPLQGVWSALGDELADQARCLVLVSGTNAAKVAERYGLTPAETRVMAAIIVGKGLGVAARELGIARSTAQSHLDKIFQKTGTNRQAELVGLASSGFWS